MTDSEHEPNQKATDEHGVNREKGTPAPFWRHPAFAVAAALIALIGMLWRCA
jgi:hypothetical protein